MADPVQPRKINQNWLAQQRNKLAVTSPSSPAHARIRAEIEKAEAEHAAWQEQQKRQQTATPTASGGEEASVAEPAKDNSGAVPNPVLDHAIQNVFGGALWMTEDPEKFAGRFDAVTLGKLSPAQRKTVADVVYKSRATTPKSRDRLRAIFAVLARKYPEFVLANESDQ